MAEWPRARVQPSGRPAMARTWFSNWLVSAPSMVQWPELCTRGAISLAMSLPRCTKNSMVSTPTYSKCSSSLRAARCAWRVQRGVAVRRAREAQDAVAMHVEIEWIERDLAVGCRAPR